MRSTDGPIRVAQIVGKMRAGGVEAFLMNYYRHIDRNRVQFDFVIDEDSPNRELIKEINALGGNVYEVPAYQNLTRYIPALETIFSSHVWPIVHSQINALSVFPLYAAKHAGVPVRIAHSHSMAGKAESVPRKVLKTSLRAFSNLYPNARMACSESAGNWLFGRNAEYQVVYDAIELEQFTYAPQARSEIRSELNLNENALVIGHVGRFMEQKNHEFLLDVFSRIARADSNSYLVLAGEGPLEESIKEKAKTLQVLDRVKFLGQRKDVNRLYSAFDVLLLPSLYEGLGMVAIEAQAAGLPCLLSDCVPREARLTEPVRFLSLDASLDEWASSCIDLVGVGQRACGVIPSGLEAYDITRAASSLVDSYESLYERLS